MLVQPPDPAAGRAHPPSPSGDKAQVTMLTSLLPLQAKTGSEKPDFLPYLQGPALWKSSVSFLPDSFPALQVSRRSKHGSLRLPSV